MAASAYGSSWVIASGQSVSNAIDGKGEVLVGVYLPATLTGDNFSFQGSLDDETYDTCTIEGSVVTFAKTNGRAVAITADKLVPWRFLKIESDGSETADRTIIPVWRRF